MPAVASWQKNLLRSVGSALTKEFEVSEGNSSRLWNNAMEQLTAGHRHFPMTRQEEA